MSLSEEERLAIVQYRIEKAYAALEDVDKPIAMKMWSVAANRLYYALYYAATALLVRDKHSVYTRGGVIILLNQYYVKPAILTKEDGWLYGRVFAFRQGSDYDDFIDANEEEVMVYLPKVKDLVAKIVSLINQQ
jgi:uncharacterized protein (UPF0332 family)